MLRTKLAAGILCLMLLSSALRSAEPVSISLPLARPMAVAYSPDGKQIAVGGLESGRDINSDGMILLLDSQSGKERAALRHSGTIKRDHGSLSYSNLIHELSYSPDGRKLAVAAQVGLKLWNPADGKELATLVGYGMDERDPQVEVTSVAFSPDGKLLAVARSPIELWDVASRKPLRQMESPGETHVTFSSDGSLLVSVSYQNRVHLWSVADGKHLAEVHADMGPLYGVAVDRQSKHVAAVGGGEKLWRIKKDAAGEWKFGDEARLTGHFVSTVRGVAFSPDGRLLATNGYDRHDHALVIYDARTREPIGTLLPGGPFAFSPDGNSLAVAQQLVQQVPGAPGGGTWYGGTRLNIWKLADLLEPGRLAEQARTAARDLVQTLAAPRAKSPFAHPGKRMMHGLLAVLSGPQGEAAAPILADALKNPQVHEKQLLLLPLQRIAGRDATARAAIIEALRTAEAVDVRAMALSALSERPGEVGQELRPADWAKEAVPALVEAALNDENPRVRGHARGLLSKLDPQALQQAAETAQARGPMVDRVKKRDGKLFYQGRPLEEWIKRLSVSYIPNEIFGRPSPDEPLAAIRAIGPDAVPVLLDTLKNGETEFLRRAAAAGLAALGPQAAPTVEPLLEVVAAADEEDLDVAGGAADALALILKERKESLPRLVELTHSDEPAVRLSAARAVAVMEANHPRGLPVLKAAHAVATSVQDVPMMMMGPFPPLPERPSIGWLKRVIADDEAPMGDRIRVAATLAQMGEAALPAMPAMLKAVAGADPTLSRQTIVAIQKIGPKMVPAVRDALHAAADNRTRQRLAATLWALGDEGRSALKEFLQGKDDIDSESLWWSAVGGNWDQRVGMQYEMAASEALEKAGKPVAPRRPQLGGHPLGDFRQMYQPPSVAWSMKLLTDPEAPRSLRLQAAGSLHRAPQGELLPFLPALLEAMVKEEDRTMISQFANAIQRMGPAAIPAVKSAIEQAPSDNARRESLRALSSLGKEGQQEFARLMRSNPKYGRLFDTGQPAEGVRQSEDRTQGPPPLEQQALAEAERTNRPLINGDFSKGLDGWNIEGGARSFRVFAQGDSQALTTYGEHQEADVGRLFQCFKVPEDAGRLMFKLHGWANREQTYVALSHKGDRLGQMAARNDNTPFEAYFDLVPLRGQVVTLEIVDHSTDSWGFIGVEDFRIITEEELNNLKAEREAFRFDVNLRGRRGEEIKGQIDTGNDAFVIRSWTNPEKRTFTPQAAALPITLYAFTADGQAYDVPDEWNGKFAGWAFLLPAELDITKVAWNEGTPTEFWKGASFGWGGLRNSLGNVVIAKGAYDETRRFQYVPMDATATSDIPFVTVEITPAKSAVSSKPATIGEQGVDATDQ